MGLFDSLFGSKTKNKNSFEPYSEAKPFLLGESGTPGIFDESARLYGQGGFLPGMQDAQNQYLQQLQGRSNSFGDMNNPAFAGNIDPSISNFTNKAASDMGTAAYGVASGAFDSNFSPVADISSQDVNLSNARRSQGVLDPTRSLSQLLSGNVQNPYLQQQANAITSNLTRNLNENVMPGIRSESLASGQYGGSRQGIAEGLAASRLNQDLAPALTNMFGGAFENAQQRMFGAATGLNDQAAANATNNANRQLTADQFNANLGLENNSQLMQKNQSNLGNRMQAIPIANNALGLLSGVQGLRAGEQGIQQNQQGLQLGSQGIQQNINDMQDQNFGQGITALGMPQDINAQNLSNYMGAIYPGAQLGGTSKGTQTQSPGIIPAALGTISGIAGIASGMGGLKGLGGMR